MGRRNRFGKCGEGVAAEDVTLAAAPFSSYQLDIPAFPAVSAFSAAVSEAFLLKAPGRTGYDPHNVFVRA